MSTLDKCNLKDPELFKTGVEYLKRRDPKIKDIIDRHGVIQFAPGGPIFDSLIESIISQQLSGSAASSIIRRMRRFYASKRLRGVFGVQNATPQAEMGGSLSAENTLPERSVKASRFGYLERRIAQRPP